MKIGEITWKILEVFKNFFREINNDSTFKKQVLKIYGGMGSFNDLVIYKEGQLC